MAPGDVDLVLTGGLCIICDEAGTVTAGDIYVDGGRIVAIGGPARAARRSVDASGTIVMPGLVNLHVEALRRQAMDVIDSYYARAGIGRIRVEN